MRGFFVLTYSPIGIEVIEWDFPKEVEERPLCAGIAQVLLLPPMRFSFFGKRVKSVR